MVEDARVAKNCVRTQKNDTYWALNNLDIDGYIEKAKDNIRLGNLEMAMSDNYFITRMLSGGR